jgi:hypothetical protein
MTWPTLRLKAGAELPDRVIMSCTDQDRKDGNIKHLVDILSTSNLEPSSFFCVFLFFLVLNLKMPILRRYVPQCVNVVSVVMVVRRSVVEARTIISLGPPFAARIMSSFWVVCSGANSGRESRIAVNCLFSVISAFSSLSTMKRVLCVLEYLGEISINLEIEAHCVH